MFVRIIKFLFIPLILLYYSSAFSKTTENKNFNQRYLSNYLSALVSYENGDNELAVKYFNSTKSIIRKYPNYFNTYVNSLVLNNKVNEAISQIKFFDTTKKLQNFQSIFLLTVDSIKKKDFKKTNNLLMHMQRILVPSSYEQLIYEILKSYNQLFITKKISEVKRYGKLSKILEAFQYCYLDDYRANNRFAELINLDNGSYSRYLFFYISNLINKNDPDNLSEVSLKIEPITSTLLILQSKNWIDQNKFEEFSKIFSCQSENDILAEIFFLISNLYSSQEEYEMSNFYLNISNYFNPKFKFNLSLTVENYFQMNKYEEAKKILKNFDKKKKFTIGIELKEFEISNEKQAKEKSLSLLTLKIKNLKFKSPKFYFDLEIFIKCFEEYEKSIENYNLALNGIRQDSDSYADILYRRGGSYERLKKYKNADEDLLLSLELNQDQPYVLNYLAYSWLERKLKLKNQWKCY